MPFGNRAQWGRQPAQALPKFGRHVHDRIASHAGRDLGVVGDDSRGEDRERGDDELAEVHFERGRCV